MTSDTRKLQPLPPDSVHASAAHTDSHAAMATGLGYVAGTSGGTPMSIVLAWRSGREVVATRRTHSLSRDRCSTSKRSLFPLPGEPGYTTKRKIMRTGAEFIASLNDGRRVWVGDELIEDLATHPKTKGYVEAIAKFYDLHHDPEFQDRTTFVDEAGVRRSRVWFIPRTKEELRQRRAFYETMMREVGGTAFSRMPDSSNAVLLTYIDDPEPWETQSIGTEGRPLAQNIRDKWAFFADEDIYTSAMFIDPQTDRGGDGSGPSPALTIVGETDEGIIVNGVKPVGTSAAFAQWLHLGVFFRPGLPPDQVIFGVIPTNTPGVTIVSRESYVNDDAANHPMAAMGDELDSAAIIENVLIPWDCVFHVRNVEHAMLYPKRVFDWHQYYVLVRAAVRAS